MHRVLLLPLALALALPLAACQSSTLGGGQPAAETAAGPESTAGSPLGGTSTGTAPTASSATVPQAPATEPAAPPGLAVPFHADLRPDEGGPQGGGGLSVVDVRAARHDGFDRVVIELDGTGAPGWLARYVDQPTADGSGAPVAVAGNAFLSVVVRGVGIPADTGVPAFAGRVTTTGTQQVREVVVGTVFEGFASSFVGIAGPPRPFRVFALAGPPRLVIDVRDH